MTDSIRRINIPVREIAWATDLHLEFVRGGSLRKFVESLAQISSDSIGITGDISDGRGLAHHLSIIATAVAKPIFVVLGNHDRYHASFAETEEQIRHVVARFPHVYRLTGREIIELSASTALVGVDGWADGESGSGAASPIILNDTVLIEDLARLSHAEAWKKIAGLSRDFAAAIKPSLDDAMAAR